MKTLILLLILASAAFCATYKGESLDGEKLAASVRINGVVEPVTVRFEEKAVEVWLDGKIVPMKLADEEISDLSAIEVFDGTKDWIINCFPD